MPVHAVHLRTDVRTLLIIGPDVAAYSAANQEKSKSLITELVLRTTVKSEYAMGDYDAVVLLNCFACRASLCLFLLLSVTSMMMAN